ncbi:MAG: protein phosphatase 2C domain-containing protein [Kiritimatiellae bacterium]|nr:protein phosphatase 2C domain-containing protein [Kiritimatiellia bacterium]MDD5519585.1 protein phosphatase 2C domain-containing protein [Kiritimatiellia bacterium]
MLFNRFDVPEKMFSNRTDRILLVLAGLTNNAQFSFATTRDNVALLGSRHRQPMSILNDLQTSSGNTGKEIDDIRCNLQNLSATNTLNTSRTILNSRFLFILAFILNVVLFVLFLCLKKNLLIISASGNMDVQSHESDFKGPHASLLKPPGEEIPDPENQVQNIASTELGSVDSRIKLFSDPFQTLCVAGTHKGNVRLNNEDYCLAFSTSTGWQVTITADGLGGVTSGEYASYYAVTAAACSIIRSFFSCRTPDPISTARKALLDANKVLCISAREWPDAFGGISLRTTLICIIATEKRFSFAYCGDGGGIVVRKGGTIQQFLFPHKAGEHVSNVLESSLGPEIEGEPSFGSIPRYPGDILFCGSDGIFDVAGPKFPIATIQTIARHNGDLKSAINEILDKLADAKDKQGCFICDDNLTIAAICDKSILPLSAEPQKPFCEKNEHRSNEDVRAS